MNALSKAMWERINNTTESAYFGAFPITLTKPCEMCGGEGKVHYPGESAPAVQEVLASLEELKHFHKLTGMDGIEFEKALDKATGLKDWTGMPNGAMWCEIAAGHSAE